MDLHLDFRGLYPSQRSWPLNFHFYFVSLFSNGGRNGRVSLCFILWCLSLETSYMTMYNAPLGGRRRCVWWKILKLWRIHDYGLPTFIQPHLDALEFFIRGLANSVRPYGGRGSLWELIAEAVNQPVNRSRDHENSFWSQTVYFEITQSTNNPLKEPLLCAPY